MGLAVYRYLDLYIEHNISMMCTRHSYDIQNPTRYREWKKTILLD